MSGRWIELRQLRYLLVAADAVSFSRAARSLNIKQAISADTSWDELFVTLLRAEGLSTLARALAERIGSA